MVQNYFGLIEGQVIDALFATKKNKTEVKEYLEQEIVGRYYYMTGQVENRLARDIDVAEAIKLFKDKERFEKLLKP